MAAIDAIRDEARATLFEVLVCMAWADRKLAPEEADALRAAAMTLGMVTPRDNVISALERGSASISDIPFAWLKPREKELAYLCAAWMLLADGESAASETSLLDELRRALDVPAARAEWLRQKALEVRSTQKPTASWWREFDRLIVGAARALDTAS
ncbi:MAG: TerB family tellurite resistance protein [Deltaproteobacteria bacterium]|nr:TerB family tellurite resistance protein [Deltaproteobacteria bacterium]